MAGGNIKVVVRVRPFNTRELDRKAKCIVQMKDSQTILTPHIDPAKSTKAASSTAGDPGNKTFAFDKSYWSFDRTDGHFAGQSNVYDDMGVPLLDNAFQGYNNCIFAYGQTGSGKSYSMMGYREEAGLIPRICRTMFERITSIQEDKNMTCTVEVSYLEIYNERVRDLLNPSTKGNLRVREHPSTGPYVEDLAQLVVRSFKEIENLMDEGNKARTVAATNMNETSSRSHAVFTLTLTQKRHDVETSMDTEKVAKISLVDLAGSERATSTGATGARLKEGAEINRSLSTLGRVIATLADLSSGKKKNASMVPYRDSVLTWLLKDSLGGNSMTAMIAAISPADINYEETLSTLRYADSAKRIKNHAVVNEDPNARMIRELKEELAQLRAKLGGSGAGGMTGVTSAEQYAPGTPLDQQFVMITQADGSTKRVSKAEIAEQLSQSEKLYSDLNQTWEQKMQKTEQIHKEREAALEELGISIEKGFIGLSTPKKMPHLVNLSDDPLLAGCLIYNLKPGTTTVGSLDNSDASCEIKLNGTKILREHCYFENSTDGSVTVTPADGAAVMVNGVRIDAPQRLRSGNRLILGDFHIFRFNHPQEARAERADSTSLLKQSVANNHLATPSPRPMADRTISRVSDIDSPPSRADSPTPGTLARELDWSAARREAAGALLGSDQKIDNLTDEALDSLFEDVQRARAVRRGQLDVRIAGAEDDESESISSLPSRDKYMSNTTIDNFSLDTALTMPDTPQNGLEEDQRGPAGDSAESPNNLQAELTQQRDQIFEQPQSSNASTPNLAELEAEKRRMATDLQSTKEQFEAQLRQQRAEFEEQLQKMYEAERSRIDWTNGYRLLTDSERQCAKYAVERWRQLRNLSMAETILRHALMLKEAQVMSQLLDKNVHYQFTVVDYGQDAASSYDMVLHGIAGDEEDDDRETMSAVVKPCVAVRVIDYNQSLIYLWSIAKLEQRLTAMRQMHQYYDRPDYLQHLKLKDPFVESSSPQFSIIGDAHVPLTAVFEARVQDYAVDVVSPYTQQVIGTLRLSLEPSSAHASPSSLGFNVVLHDLAGFPEREGTDLHAQMTISGLQGEGGATTTQMIRGFDESSIRFESVHSMSIPQDSPASAVLQIIVFARITSMHLDKLRSWDEVRELAEQPARSRKVRPRKARRPETDFYALEQHDVVATYQIQELGETGEYLPVEVEPSGSLEEGIYQLHQGLQRRIRITLLHTSNESLGWESIVSVHAGHVRLVDPHGKTPDLRSRTPDIPLKFVTPPAIRTSVSGSTQLTALVQWDSSLHDSVLLNRPTADKYSIRISLTVAAAATRADTLLSFTLDQTLQIRPRSWLRSSSLLGALWRPAATRHATSGVFSIALAPVVSKRAGDLWRLDSRHQYVKGEEALQHWAPRGVSLVQDYADAKRKRLRMQEVDAARASLARTEPVTQNWDVPPDVGSGTGTAGDKLTEDQSGSLYTDRQSQLLQHVISLWRRPLVSPAVARDLASPPSSPPPRLAVPAPSHVSSAANGTQSPSPSPSAHGLRVNESHTPSSNVSVMSASAPVKLAATITQHPRNPVILKAGPLLTPYQDSFAEPGSQAAAAGRADATTTGDTVWVRRHAELRPPYLYLHSIPEGELVSVLNLRHATVDAEPEIARLLVASRHNNLVSSNGNITGPGNNNQRSGQAVLGLDRERERVRVLAQGVWAIYGSGTSWVLRVRSLEAKREWLWAIQQAFLPVDPDPDPESTEY